MISRIILINFQTNPMINVNFFTFVHKLLDSPSYEYFFCVEKMSLSHFFQQKITAFKDVVSNRIMSSLLNNLARLTMLRTTDP